MEIKQINKKDLIKKAKKFFQSQKWKDLLVFLVFVILAFGFWILQYFQQKIERDITIPIHYTNIPPEIVINDSIPDQLTIKIADKGTVFLRDYLYTEKLAIDIDLKDLSPDKSSYVVNRNFLNYEIQEMLANSTQLLSFKPENIQIQYSPRRKKEFPIVIVGKISPASGYIFTDTLHLEPATVWAYGDKKQLDTIKSINTLNTQIENIRKNLDVNLVLDVPKGLHLSEEKVNVTANVEEYTEKTFNLPIITYNLPENINIRFFPSSVEVTCRIALSMYSKLTAEDLEVSVDYQDISKNPGINIILELSRKPDWMINYRISPEVVEYLIEQK